MEIQTLSPKSLQEILEERRQSSFVGRANETLDFEANIKLAPDDPQRRFVFAVAGQGGMGKTTLMSRCRMAAESAGYATAWSNEDDDDLIKVIDQLARDLGSRHFQELKNKLDEYRQVRHKIESDPDAPESVARVIAGAAGRGVTKLARRVPGAGIPLELIDEEAVGDAVGDVAIFIMQRAKHRHDAELVLDPIGVLAPMFVRGIGKLAEERPIALFFDTYEETSHFLEAWLQRLLAAEYGQVPSNFLCSIVGRLPLASEAWGPYESLIKQIELGPLSDEEVEEFLRKKGVSDPGTIAEMTRLSNGLPILLVSMTIGTPKAVKSDTAVELVLRSVPEEFRSVALDAAVPRTLDRDLAKVAIEHEDPNHAFEWLLTMPFVQDASDGWRYHPVIREEFLQFSKRESASDLAVLHTRMEHFHKERWDKGVSDEDFMDALAHAVEEAYHQIATGAKDAIMRSNCLCIAMWEQAPLITRHWAQAIHDGERDLVKGTSSGWGQGWFEAIDENFEGHEQPAIEIFSRLLNEEELPNDHRVLALTIRSDLYFERDRYDVALNDIDAAIEIDNSKPRLRYERAWIHLRCERIEEAFEDAEAALIEAGKEAPAAPKFWDLYVKCASKLLEPAQLVELIDSVEGAADQSWALRARGRALRELERLEEAISAFEQIREMSEGNRHLANEELGYTYVQMGVPAKAIIYFENALELQPECVACWRGLQFAASKATEGDDVEAVLKNAACGDSATPGTRAARAVALLAAGLSDTGFAELERAIEENPNHPDFRLWLARGLCNHGQFEGAIESIEAALHLRPDWPKAIALRGTCRFNVEDFSGAIEDWTQVERSAPAETVIVSACDWGLSLSIIGDYEEAITRFDRDTSSEPSPELTYNRVVASAALYGADAVRDEIEEARRIVTNAEGELVKHYGLGGLAALQGDTDSACAELERACDADGERARRWAKSDPAWNGIRTSATFHRVLAPSK